MSDSKGQLEYSKAEYSSIHHGQYNPILLCKKSIQDSRKSEREKKLKTKLVNSSFNFYLFKSNKNSNCG